MALGFYCQMPEFRRACRSTPDKFECIGRRRSAWCTKAELSDRAQVPLDRSTLPVTAFTRPVPNDFSLGRTTEGRLSFMQQGAKTARLLPKETWSRCYRCGAEIPEFEFFEPFKSRLRDLTNKHDRIQIVKELRDESGCEFATAKQWVSHKTFELPEATPCPYCGQPLRTARARQCRFCLRDWH